MKTIWLKITLLCIFAASCLSESIASVNSPSVYTNHFLKTSATFSVAVPVKGWPPYVYVDAEGQYSGPLIQLIRKLSEKLGITINYTPFFTYTSAREALGAGEVDILFGFFDSERDEESISLNTINILTMPRSILLREGYPIPSLANAKEMRFGCELGSAHCSALSSLGIKKIITVKSDQEGVVLLQHRMIDGYVADRPTLLWHQEYDESSLQLVMPSWLKTSNMVAIISTQRNKEFKNMISFGINQIPLSERQDFFDKPQFGKINEFRAFSLPSLSQVERHWLLSHGPLRFAVAPYWSNFSEIDKHGQLKGYLNDLFNLLRQRTGLIFTLVPTSSWEESLRLFDDRKVDFLPGITPTENRKKTMLFTPDYASAQRVIIGKSGDDEITTLSELKGKRIGIVSGSYEETILRESGAIPITFPSNNFLLPQLDLGNVDYILLPVSNVQDSITKNFNQRYAVVYSDENLNQPISMAVQRDAEILQGILTKALQTIKPDELANLQRRWLNLTIQTGLNPEKVVLWGSIGTIIFISISLLFILWNRTLRRQVIRRVIAEKCLEEQISFIQLLVDSLPTLVVLTNERHEIIMSNYSYRDVFFSGQDLKGSYNTLLDSHLSKDIIDNIISDDKHIWETGVELSGNGEVKLKNGLMCQLLYTKKLLVNENGSRLGILTVLTDITELRQAKVHAQEMEARLTQLTDNVPGFVYQQLYRSPEDSKIIYVSAGIESSLGVTRETLYNLNSLLAAFKHVGITIDESKYVPLFIHQVTKEHQLDLVFELITLSGEELSFQLKGKVLPTNDNGFMLFVMVQNITTLRHQARELQHARNIAEQAMQARSRFLATMSHELRTPISGMHGMLELLEISDLNENQKYLLRNVQGSANNLLYLVNDILDFSKIEANQLHLDIQLCNLHIVLCDIIRSHTSIAKAKGLIVNLKWGLWVPIKSYFDPVRIGQILSNLLSNAIKFTAKGEITISINWDDNQLTIAIKDTGIGIPHEKINRLFTPFEQLDVDITRRYGGSGLGLSICYLLAKQMNGSLTVESELAQGTCIIFNVPLCKEEQTFQPLLGTHWNTLDLSHDIIMMMKSLGATLSEIDDDAVRKGIESRLLADEDSLKRIFGNQWQEQLLMIPTGGIIFSQHEQARTRLNSSKWWRLGNAPTYPDLLCEVSELLISNQSESIYGPQTPILLDGYVLVVDDHPINRELLLRQLNTLGVTAKAVENGQDAITYWNRDNFDLLLTDCHMPFMDGYSLTKQLRSMGENKPIIGVTADASEEAVSNMANAGMNDKLFKPYTLNTLWHILNKWLPDSHQKKSISLEIHNEETQEQISKSWIGLFGNEENARTMALEYIRSNTQDESVIRKALNEKDLSLFPDAAHRIKGSAKMVGLIELADSATQLEAAVKGLQWEECVSAGERLLALMQIVKNDIGVWLNDK
ncbi:transporter substrate-binding domain-containing protein [Aeromonas veronii]|nr:hypothetical protein B7G55_11840 [Aeromonas hydrophila]QHB82407.1 transporter substrate-binding domain-containing protein [Aeromonas veronii]